MSHDNPMMWTPKQVQFMKLLNSAWAVNANGIRTKQSCVSYHKKIEQAHEIMELIEHGFARLTDTHVCPLSIYAGAVMIAPTELGMMMYRLKMNTDMGSTP